MCIVVAPAAAFARFNYRIQSREDAADMHLSLCRIREYGSVLLQSLEILPTTLPPVDSVNVDLYQSIAKYGENALEWAHEARDALQRHNTEWANYFWRPKEDGIPEIHKIGNQPVYLKSVLKSWVDRMDDIIRRHEMASGFRAHT